MDQESIKKDIPESSNIIKNSNNIFNIGDFFTYVIKKTEKLVSAIYLVTGHFPESEPLKTNLRQKSTSLMSFITTSKYYSGFEYEFSKEVESRIVEILSFLEISKNIGLVSSANFEILNTEFSSLVERLRSNSLTNSRHSSVNDLASGYFDLGDIFRQKGLVNRDITPSAHQGIYRPQRDGDSHVNEGHFKKNNRQNSILSLIKSKKEVTIKDISKTISNCSEKTIQRELVSLISLGLIKRSGERRWSKYSLV